jgi:hypothetical protein
MNQLFVLMSLGCKDKTEFQSLNFGIDLDGFTEAMSDAEE